MKKRMLFLSFSLFVSSIALSAQTWILDQNFGNGGALLTPDSFNIAGALTIDEAPGGKFLISGALALEDDNIYRVLLARFMADGSYDPTFGNNGIYVFENEDRSMTYYTDLVVLEDGSIIIGGQSIYLNSDGDNDMTFFKLDANGAPDSSFGTDGFLVFDWNETQLREQVVMRMALMPDGDIVCAGFTFANPVQRGILIRFSPQGVIRENFGDNGLVALDIGTSFKYQDVAIDPQGRLLVSGINFWSSDVNGQLVARFLDDGSLDNSFHQTGINAYFNLPWTEGNSRALIMGNDILLIGGTNAEMGSGLLLKLLENGNIDASFGDYGRVLFRKQEYQSYFNQVALLPNDSLIAFGNFFVPVLPQGRNQKVLIQLFSPEGVPVEENEITFDLEHEESFEEMIMIDPNNILFTGLNFNYPLGINGRQFVGRLTREMSSSVSEQKKGREAFLFRLFPNPIQAENLNLQYLGKEATTANIRVYGQQGEKLMEYPAIELLPGQAIQLRAQGIAGGGMAWVEWADSQGRRYAEKLILGK